MSRTLAASLMFCFTMPGEDLYEACMAVPEVARDAAWNAAADISMYGFIDEPQGDQLQYIGWSIGHGYAGSDEVMHTDQIAAYFSFGVNHFINKVLENIQLHRKDSPVPEYQAFLDWLTDRCNTATDWGLRLVPYVD